jgi:hypothetical protein
MSRAVAAKSLSFPPLAKKRCGAPLEGGAPGPASRP